MDGWREDSPYTVVNHLNASIYVWSGQARATLSLIDIGPSHLFEARRPICLSS